MFKDELIVGFIGIYGVDDIVLICECEWIVMIMIECVIVSVVILSYIELMFVLMFV